MKTVIYLNRWNDIFHLMLTKVAGEQSRRLDNRYALSLEETRKAVDYWRTEYEVVPEDIHDNSSVDLDVVFVWMDVDMSQELTRQTW